MQQAPAQPGQAPAGSGGQGRGAAAQAGRGRGGRAPAPPVPPEFDPAPIWKLDEPGLIAILKNSQSTLFQKAIACKKLAQIGTRASVAPLAALLGEQRLGHYARFGLETNPDPSVDEALRAALPKLKGRVLMGLITTIGVRRDARAIEPLGKLLYDSDPEIAQASAAALGRIGGAQAGKLLREALNRTKPPVMPVVARACLLCVESLSGAQATEMWTALGASTMPKSVQRAAFRATNAAAPGNPVKPA